MKINLPHSTSGSIIVEYLGNNEFLRNTENGYFIKSVKIEPTVKLVDNEIKSSCFKIKLYNKDLLIVLNGLSVFEIVTEENGIISYIESNTYLSRYRILKHSRTFIAVGRIYYFLVNNDTDVREEVFKYTLILDNNPKIQEMLDEEEQNNN